MCCTNSSLSSTGVATPDLILTSGSGGFHTIFVAHLQLTNIFIHECVVRVQTIREMSESSKCLHRYSCDKLGNHVT
jgi:hypothetical protein